MTTLADLLMQLQADAERLRTENGIRDPYRQTEGTPGEIEYHVLLDGLGAGLYEETH